jgi:hypothetical protein
MRDRRAMPLAQHQTATSMTTNVPHHFTPWRTRSRAYTHTCNHAHPHSHDHPKEPAAAVHDSHAPNNTSSTPTSGRAHADRCVPAAPKRKRLPREGFIRFASAPSKSSALTEDSKDCGWSWWILNWAFGRWKLVRKPASFIVDSEGDGSNGSSEAVRLTVMTVVT